MVVEAQSETSTYCAAGLSRADRQPLCRPKLVTWAQGRATFWINAKQRGRGGKGFGVVFLLVFLKSDSVNNKRNLHLFLPRLNLNSPSVPSAQESPVSLGYYSLKTWPWRDLLSLSQAGILWEYKQIGASEMGKGTCDQAWKSELDL